jgi:hypothetical protein
MINLLLSINPIESSISNGLTSVINNNAILALLMVAFFMIFVMLQGTRLDGKVAIMIPALFLAIALEPIFAFVVVLGVGILAWRALNRIDQG